MHSLTMWTDDIRHFPSVCRRVQTMQPGSSFTGCGRLYVILAEGSQSGSSMQ